MQQDELTKTEKSSKLPIVFSSTENDLRHMPILDLSKTKNMKAAVITLKPGENVGTHNTRQKEEVIVVLEGTCKVEAEGIESQLINKGAIVYIPPENQHTIFNAGESVLKYIYVTVTTQN